MISGLLETAPGMVIRSGSLYGERTEMGGYHEKSVLIALLLLIGIALASAARPTRGGSSVVRPGGF